VKKLFASLLVGGLLSLALGCPPATTPSGGTGSARPPMGGSSPPRGIGMPTEHGAPTEKATEKAPEKATEKAPEKATEKAAPKATEKGATDKGATEKKPEK
jgi:hypothetical protein